MILTLLNKRIPPFSWKCKAFLGQQKSRFLFVLKSGLGGILCAQMLKNQRFLALWKAKLFSWITPYWWNTEKLFHNFLCTKNPLDFSVFWASKTTQQRASFSTCHQCIHWWWVRSFNFRLLYFLTFQSKFSKYSFMPFNHWKF